MTLRFEIQPGDHAWFDGSSVDRAEIDGSEGGCVQPNTPIAINWLNGPNGSFTNNASWFVVGEMNNDDTASGVPTSPSFAIQLDGDHLQVVARYAHPGVDPSNAAGNLKTLTLWTDPNPIQTNHYNNISIKANDDSIVRRSATVTRLRRTATALTEPITRLAKRDTRHPAEAMPRVQARLRERS